MWTPGIRKRIGRYWLGKELNHMRGDADVLGLVRAAEGWEFIACDFDSDGDDQWLRPVDDDERPFPAEGVPEQPPRLYGCPIAIGYKQFGALAEIPNVEIARDLIIDARTPGSDREDVPAGDGAADPGVLDRMRGWYRDKKAGLASWWSDWRFSRGWGWTQGRADALIIEEDGDNAVVMERANFTAGQDEPDWFETGCGYYYDARGHGGPPTEAGPADVGIAYAEVPRLLAPSLCRLSRNMREVKIEDGTYQYGGRAVDAQTGQAMTDGGAAALGDGMPEPKVAQPGDGAIEVEERAFVDPEDVKLLGGAQETQDKIETLLKQVEAKENTPGSSLASNLLDFGKIMVAFTIGSVLGGGGGGGGGGSMIPLSLMPDPTALQPALEVMSLVGL